MKKLFRLILRLAIFAFIIIVGIATVKTVGFTSKQIPVEPVEPIAIPESAIEHLSKAVQIPTVSEENKVDTTALLNLDTLIQQAFPNVDSLLEKTYVNRFSLVYKWAGRNPKLPPVLLLGHMDVVPVESEAAWSVSPFSGEVHKGYIWGRGTMDDKLNVFGILEAAEMLLKEDYQPERTVYFAFGHDEEISGEYGAKAIAARFEQQGIRFEYVLDEGQLIIENALPGLDPPLGMIGVAEKGYVTLHLLAKQEEGGHSSMPPKETVIGVLSKAIVKLQTNPFPGKIDGATKGLLQHAGPEMNFPYNVLFANLWLSEGLLKNIFSGKPSSNALIRTTTAPTIIEGGVKDNVLPTSASAKINFRILPGETIESVTSYVQNIIDDPRVSVATSKIEFGQNPSPVSDEGTFGFLVIQKSIREVFPETVVAPALVIGATDSRHYQSVSDQIYRFQPIQISLDDTKRFHGIDERISVENYKQAIRFYRQLILNSCK